MAFDYKKEYKALYQPPREPQFVTVPAMTFAAVRGQGDPNDPTGEYKAAIELLYGLLYTIKMSKKGSHRVDGYFDFVVPPLEGLWEQTGTGKESFHWTSMLRLPEFVTREEFDWAVREATAKKKKDFSKVEFFTYEGAGHAFDNPNPLFYDEAASEPARERTMEFLGRHLPVG